MESDPHAAIAEQFGISLDDVKRYAARAAHDLSLGSIRFEPELVSRYGWSPEKADSFIRALMASR